MSTLRLVTLAATGALLLDLGAASVASAAPDPTFPTGTYSVWKTSGYAYEVDLGDVAFPLWVSEESASDDVTPSKDLQRTLDLGNGTSWPMYQDGGRGAFLGYGQYSFAGTYHPKVLLTDGDGHTTEIPLPAITVLTDEIAPTVRTTVPRQRHRTSAWKVVRGTARDTGGTGLDAVGVQVLQKRGLRWWTYDFSDLRWVRGTKHFTYSSQHGYSTDLVVTDGHWHTPKVPGLTRSRLVILTSAEDNAENSSRGPLVDVRLRRR